MANWDLQRYKDFKPTQFDHHIELDDREDWFVLPVSRNRDSEALAESNFETCLEILGGEQDDLVEVHRFGHWGNGWFEIILANPDLEDQCAEIEASLADYPVLDEEDLSAREWEELAESWENWGRRDFASILKQAFGLSYESADWVGDNIEMDDFGLLRQVAPLACFHNYLCFSRSDDIYYGSERAANHPEFTREICGQWLRRVRRRVEADKAEVKQLEMAIC